MLVCLEGFDPKGRKRIQDGNIDITILKQDENYFAFNSKCPHKGGPLFLCKPLSGERIMCPSHHIVFNLRDGEVLENPLPESMGDYALCPNLKIYEVVLDQNGLNIIV